MLTLLTLLTLLYEQNVLGTMQVSPAGSKALVNRHCGHLDQQTAGPVPTGNNPAPAWIGHKPAMPEEPLSVEHAVSFVEHTVSISFFIDRVWTSASVETGRHADRQSRSALHVRLALSLARLMWDHPNLLCRDML